MRIRQKNTKVCQKEWNLAWADVPNGMYWQHEWGPYFVGGATDNPKALLKAPAFEWVAQSYKKQLCPSGSCYTNAKGKDIIVTVGNINYCKCK